MPVALSISELEVSLPVVGGFWRRRRGTIRPVAGVNLELAAGETVGLVGESGCGKSSLARAVAGLGPVSGGTVRVAGQELTALRGRDLRRARRAIQMVFQDPHASLNPRLTVEATLGEAVSAGCQLSRGKRTRRVERLLHEVGLTARLRFAYPHELSGGQRQRVSIARALAASPSVIVADEPTSALDVPVQARILNLLRHVQQLHGLAILLISHDLHLIRRVSRRVTVMYLGHVVEVFRVDSARAPLHPYARALVEAAPSLRDGLAGRPALIPEGEAPSLLEPPAGCPYHPRCPLRRRACTTALPVLQMAGPEHLVRCPFVT